MPLTLRIPGRIVFTFFRSFVLSFFRSFRLQTQGGPPADFNRRAVKLNSCTSCYQHGGAGVHPMRTGHRMKHQITFPAPDSQPLTTLSDLQSFFLEKYGEAYHLARRSVEAAWIAGRALTQIKQRLPYGSFRSWLADEGIAKSTSSRLMQLAREELSDVADFPSMTAALASLQSPKALLPADTSKCPPSGTFEPANDPEPPPIATSPPVTAVEPTPPPIEAEVVEVEPAQHDVVAYLEAQNQELTAEVVDLRERLALATEHWSNDAYQTLEKVNKAHRQELATLRGDLHSASNQNYEAIKRRLGRIRGTLLERGTCRACNDVLAKDYGTARK